MPRDSAYLRALTAVLFTAVCAWLAAALFAPGNAQSHVRAEYMELYESLPLHGLVLRHEQALYGESLLPASAFGDRLAAGSVLGQREGESILSPSSGIYYENTDGFEYLSPEILKNLDGAMLSELMARRPQSGEKSFGRLVTGRDWYYAAFTPRRESVPEKGKCRLRFDGDIEREARLIDIRDAGEELILIFRLTAEDRELLSLRRCSASLILSGHEGLAVPTEAVFTDGQGNKFVYCCTALGTEKTAVECIYESGRLCLVRALEEGQLPPGSRVISHAAEGLETEGY